MYSLHCYYPKISVSFLVPQPLLPQLCPPSNTAFQFSLGTFCPIHVFQVSSFFIIDMLKPFFVGVPSARSSVLWQKVLLYIHLYAIYRLLD